MSRSRATLLATLAVLAVVVAWFLWKPSPPEPGAPPSPVTASEAETERHPKAGPSPDATAQAALPTNPPPDPGALSGTRVQLPPDLRVRLQSAQAAELALSAARRSFGFIDLGDGSRFYPTDPADGPAFRVTSVVASRATDLPRIDPEWRGDPEHYGDRPIWMIRLDGPFRFQAGPSGAEGIEATSGFYVIDDASGEVLSWGVP